MRFTLTPPPNLDFSGLEKEALQNVLEAMQGGVQLIVNDAKRSVATGPKTGRIYTQFFRTGPNGGVFPVEKRSAPHQASAPGEAPATDTGKLISSIVGDAAIVSGDKVEGYVDARTVYATYLEYGTRKMAARPFLQPAIDRNAQRVTDFIRLALTTASQRFARKQR